MNMNSYWIRNSTEYEYEKTMNMKWYTNWTELNWTELNWTEMKNEKFWTEWLELSNGMKKIRKTTVYLPPHLGAAADKDISKLKKKKHICMNVLNVLNE